MSEAKIAAGPIISTNASKVMSKPAKRAHTRDEEGLRSKKTKTGEYYSVVLNDGNVVAVPKSHIDKSKCFMSIVYI